MKEELDDKLELTKPKNFCSVKDTLKRMKREAKDCGKQISANTIR